MQSTVEKHAMPCLHCMPVCLPQSHGKAADTVEAHILVSRVGFQVRLDVFPGRVQLEGLGVAQQAGKVLLSFSLLGLFAGQLVLGFAHLLLVEQLPAATDKVLWNLHVFPSQTECPWYVFCYPEVGMAAVMVTVLKVMFFCLLSLDCCQMHTARLLDTSAWQDKVQK